MCSQNVLGKIRFFIKHRSRHYIYVVFRNPQQSICRDNHTTCSNIKGE